MTEKFKGQHAGVPYGRILGAPGVIRDEFEALTRDIGGTLSGQRFLGENPLDGMKSTWVFRCEQAAKLERGLRENDLREDLAGRVSGIRQYFTIMIKTAGHVPSLSSYGEFMKLLGDMQNGSDPVLPDIGVVNSGACFCETYKQFQGLYAMISRSRMKPDCKFFNNWLKVCHSSASEVVWVCEKAKEAGYPDLNHEARTVFCGLCRGSSGREVRPTLSVPEMIYLKNWIVNNRIKNGGGKIWPYIVNELIAPVTRGTDSHVTGLPLSFSPAIRDGDFRTVQGIVSSSPVVKVTALSNGVRRRRINS